MIDDNRLIEERGSVFVPFLYTAATVVTAVSTLAYFSALKNQEDALIWLRQETLKIQYKLISI